jgi:hypothetical protein
MQAKAWLSDQMGMSMGIPHKLQACQIIAPHGVNFRWLQRSNAQLQGLWSRQGRQQASPWKPASSR